MTSTRENLSYAACFTMWGILFRPPLTILITDSWQQKTRKHRPRVVLTGHWRAWAPCWTWGHFSAFRTWRSSLGSRSEGWKIKANQIAFSLWLYTEPVELPSRAVPSLGQQPEKNLSFRGGKQMCSGTGVGPNSSTSHQAFPLNTCMCH